VATKKCEFTGGADGRLLGMVKLWLRVESVSVTPLRNRSSSNENEG
jgi:hypothetical protein